MEEDLKKKLERIEKMSPVDGLKELGNYVAYKGDFNGLSYQYIAEEMDFFIISCAIHILDKVGVEAYFDLLRVIEDAPYGIVRQLGALKAFLPEELVEPFQRFRKVGMGISAGATRANLFPALRAIGRFARKNEDWIFDRPIFMNEIHFGEKPIVDLI